MILITGANGFIGRHLCQVLLDNGVEFCAACRQKKQNPMFQNAITVGDIGPETNWADALRDVKVVIHLAARVHVMHDKAVDPLAEFRHVNVDGTLNLARQAAEHGVRRFIYISSIKVNGEGTQLDRPFFADNNPAPSDPYAISKYEAEQSLLKLASETEMDVVIIRPPLVYGPGVKANFLSMMRWVNKGIPLPLGAINNKRSLVAVENLIDLIIRCIEHPAAANEVFLVGDDYDLTITELLKKMGLALNKPAKLIPVPAKILYILAKILGKKDMAVRLLGSLQVDIEKTKKLLNWKPPVSVDDALKKTAIDFLKNNQS
jgi:nucleoside-diphosphate-sugar epimerase